MTHEPMTVIYTTIIYNYTKEFLRLNVLRRHCRPICTERIFTPLGGKSIAQSQTNKQENVCQKYV